EKMTWCPWYMQGDNTMAAAVQFANRITTVSPTYARQIQTPIYGENLEGLLSYISGNLVGIVNGIDTEVYDPAKDVYLKQNFTPETIEKRLINKIALQEEVGLQVSKSAFVMAMVTRLVEQKGIDLVMQILDRFLTYTDAQLIILGTGDRYYETQLWEMTSRFRGRMSLHLLYSDALSRRIYGGADALLMPSRFEPCGISQLMAMRYGCIPMVRRTGGLVDTVSFHDPIQEKGTGFSFDRYEPLDLFTCMIRTWESFRYKQDWQKLQQRAMTQDFSWYKSALEYLKIYKQITGQSEQLSDEEKDKLVALTSS
ncbi:MAG: glycogen synthase GlgA, partial [Microcystis sp. M53601_WE4]|nr:glycogen synthase GlgA [Microcystis sp. M53601_WE4]